MCGCIGAVSKFETGLLALISAAAAGAKISASVPLQGVPCKRLHKVSRCFSLLTCLVRWQPVEYAKAAERITLCSTMCAIGYEARKKVNLDRMLSTTKYAVLSEF